MGDLPIERVKPSKPFSHSGVDFAGPFHLKPIQGRGKTIIKAYVAIFVCFATRAVHLELVMDLTADAFIAAFKRFVSRRGRCSKLFSDNASNFVSAEKKLQEHIRSIEKDERICALFVNEGTAWHFIPPVSPHFGGLWEASVKSFKHHFRRIAGGHTLTIEQMLTLTTQIEACLNSRPLAAISDDPDDFSVISPGHFLVGERLITVPTVSTLDISENRLDRWQLTQTMFENLWQIWYKDYIHNLQLRHKWQTPQESIKLNDLVLINDENLPPAKWALGRITACHPGKDGLVRVVTIKTKDRSFDRAVTKICPLPVNANN